VAHTYIINAARTALSIVSVTLIVPHSFSAYDASIHWKKKVYSRNIFPLKTFSSKS